MTDREALRQMIKNLDACCIKMVNRNLEELCETNAQYEFDEYFNIFYWGNTPQGYNYWSNWYYFLTKPGNSLEFKIELVNYLNIPKSQEIVIEGQKFMI